jgi:hypothetical protein
LPIKELRKTCLSVKLRRKKDFGCSLTIHCPTEDFFHLLAKYETDLADYKISYLEVAADFLCRSKKVAIIKARAASKKIMVKNLNHVFHFRSNRPISIRNLGRFFSPETWYWGPPRRKMRLVIYACYSKLKMPHKIPCVHFEWRFRRARTVKKKTGIVKLRDLINFDFERFFALHDRKSLRFRKIDYEFHGTFLLRSSPEPEVLVPDCSITSSTPGRVSRKFCKRHGINHPVLFKKYYLQQTKGFHAPREEEFHSLSYYRIQSFLKRAEAPFFLSFGQNNN